MLKTPAPFCSVYALCLGLAMYEMRLGYDYGEGYMYQFDLANCINLYWKKARQYFTPPTRPSRVIGGWIL